MNKTILVMMVAAMSSLFCKESDDKIRVSSNEIYLGEQDMFAKVKGEWIPIESLFHDTEGFYVNPTYQTRNEIFRWLCNCGGYNFASDNLCMNCGGERYGKEVQTFYDFTTNDHEYDDGGSYEYDDE